MLISLLLAMQAATLPQASATPAAQAQTAVVTTPSGLRFQVLEPGSGRRPTAEDAVRVTYEGRLADGTVFESTTEPVGLSVADLIPGFTEALQLMNVGGRYRFWMPPQLAYGDDGVAGTIPPNAELEFTLTLMAVGRAAEATGR
ncbi:MAG TPA: FKBP-type peptidyl-prolyl cis-trans isomerase [Allosphingosinicella sp.]